MRAVVPIPRADAPSLYVHVPYCVVKCGYCDFNSFAVRPDDVEAFDRFLGALELELERRVRRPPRSVFVGGGTPTFLEESRFERMLSLVSSVAGLGPDVETTIEANPESVTRTKARLARDAGVNRVSIGVQSFDRDALLFLDRAHDAAAVSRAVEAFRDAGFDNLSLDLIYALPGQSVAAWRRDLEQALELEPDHLSCYALTYESGTRLTHRMRRGEVTPIDAEVEREMFETTHAILRERGFEPYEVSNFAGRGGPCRHNDYYWLQGDYVGVGPGAASHESGWRATNLKPVEAWCLALEAGLPPTGEAETLTRVLRAGEAIWLGLRRMDGVDLDAISARLGVEVREAFADEFAEAFDRGQVELAGRNLRLTDAGRPYADAVGSEFLVPNRAIRAS
jgi:oxygen-independent coproporphyrinogen-3 oxidase